MPFNSNDYTSPPWIGGIMTLTHEECVFVKTECQKIIDEFITAPDEPNCDDFYVVSHYNRLDWNKAINGDTYAELKKYDADTMTSGIPL